MGRFDAARPRPAPVSPRLTRRELVDRLLSGSAGFLAVCALAVSGYQAYLAREQQRMSAWPYLSVANTGENGFGKVVRNAGLGPALVRSFVVTVDGQPQHTWGGVARAVLRDDSAAWAVRRAGVDSGPVVSSTLGRGVVLLPGSTLELVHVEPGHLALTMHDALNDARVGMRVCYCSLYGDCWTAGDSREPAPVRACAQDEGREFGL